MKENISFFGLSDAAVRERVARGEVNRFEQCSSRSVSSILRSNIFNRFNVILSLLLAIIVTFGSLHDALFGIVMVLNAVIGIVQELRAKWTLDRLSLLNAVPVAVLRNGVKISLPADQVVKDDVVLLTEGETIIADGEMLHTNGLEIDESLLTGEAEAILKHDGDPVLSGSVVLAGDGVCRGTKVGADAYINTLAKEARHFALAQSELRGSIDVVLKIVVWLMLPVAIMLFLTELGVTGTIDSAAVATVSGLIGMIPQGLVLLTSMVFAISVIRLGQRHVLVQELSAVENLARVDVVCFDKTGTITDGAVAFDRLEPVEHSPLAEMALGTFARAFEDSGDPLLSAVRSILPPATWEISRRLPFSPKRRWSAVEFAEQGSWVLGAPETLLERVSEPGLLRERLERLTREGSRVLLLARTSERIVDEILPRLTPVTLVIFRERIRTDVEKTFSYFKEQGVMLKVISGDDPRTVSTIAAAAGLESADLSVDMQKLPANDQRLGDTAESVVVFGRVDPYQKRDLVQALQKKGHIVAMVGDGVNDILAVKQADLGISLGSGAPATRAVAQIVLLNGLFDNLPHILAEGRRVLANIERVANLFVTKSVYAASFVLAVGLMQWPFFMLPRHFTLIGVITIGVPAFFLSLTPSFQRYQPGLLSRLMRFTIPAGIVVGATVPLGVFLLRNIEPSFTTGDVQTLATIIISLLGLYILSTLATPLLSWRGALIGILALSFILVFVIPFTRVFFALDIPTPNILTVAAIVVGAAVVLLNVLWRSLQLLAAPQTIRISDADSASIESTE